MDSFQQTATHDLPRCTVSKTAPTPVFIPPVVSSQNLRASRKRKRGLPADIIAAAAEITASTPDLTSCNDCTSPTTALAWLSTQLEADRGRVYGTIAPRLQRQMVRTALAVGSLPVIEDLQNFIRYYRTHGQLDGSAAATALTGSAEHRTQQVLSYAEGQLHLRTRRVEVQRFCHAWFLVHRSEAFRFLTALKHRQTLAHLADCHKEAAKGIEVERSGRGHVVSQAKQVLFKAVHPNWKDVPEPASDPATKVAWAKFGKTLVAANRWKMLEERLGRGVFTLIPEAQVLNTFIQYTLTTEQVTLWVRLLEHIRPTCLEFGRRMLEASFWRPFEGGVVSKRRCRLEVASLSTLRAAPTDPLLIELIDEGELSSDDEQAAGVGLCSTDRSTQESRCADASTTNAA